MVREKDREVHIVKGPGIGIMGWRILRNIAYFQANTFVQLSLTKRSNIKRTTRCIELVVHVNVRLTRDLWVSLKYTSLKNLCDLILLERKKTMVRKL